VLEDAQGHRGGGYTFFEETHVILDSSHCSLRQRVLHSHPPLIVFS